LWDVSSGKQIQSFEGHSGPVLSVQFSPDGNRIISGSGDKTIRLWDALSGKQIQSLEGHSDVVYSVQFSPDGNKIASGSYDETIRLHVAGMSDVSNNSILVADDRKFVSDLQDKKSLWKCIWQGGTYLSLKGSTWKDAKGVTLLQMSVVEQYGGAF
ncbi:hypothetical protein RFI_40078, partial [Reticulomyxa filosa]